MVGELYKLAEKSQKQVQKPTGQGRLLQWYFFLVAAFWMYFRWPTAPSFLKSPHKHILSDLQQESHRTVSARGFLAAHKWAWMAICMVRIRVAQNLRAHYMVLQVYKESAGGRDHLERAAGTLLWLGAQEAHHPGILTVHCRRVSLICFAGSCTAKQLLQYHFALLCCR